MSKSEELKRLVRDKYSQIAEQPKSVNEKSCCGAGSCSGVDYTIFSEDYSHLEGYLPDADLGLGCGLPTEYAKIKPGDVVVDLGSGAGNDCFVARSLTGESGKVIGIDMTPVMIEKARQNAAKLGFKNVEFRLGEIEDIPMGGNRADVVISNCVLNLVPDKAQAFREIFRILKPGGHFSISDVVVEGELPEALKSDAEMYAGCVAGAIQLNEYLEIIRQTGFEQITIQKKKPIDIPEDILQRYLDQQSLENWRQGSAGLFSITVFATKPGESTRPCAPGSGCC
ncbi:MAG: arsenite S-adenosylmethyltransferase [Saprospiraceae bacterium]|nr:MAG: arsenite S-adenosylmethyltransferase [Saprospiraceae bacterium]